MISRIRRLEKVAGPAPNEQKQITPDITLEEWCAMTADERIEWMRAHMTPEERAKHDESLREFRLLPVEEKIRRLRDPGTRNRRHG